MDQRQADATARMAWAPDEIEFEPADGPRTATVRNSDGVVLGYITLNDGNLTASTPALQKVCDGEVDHWHDAETAYRWLLRGNGYLTAVEE